MPPSGTLAVVEFVHVEEAGRAFRSVAYRRLGNSIIYLEWAPEGLLTESSGRQTASASVKPVTVPEQEGVPVTTEEQHASIRSGSTLFIKNLSFATTSDRLAQVFRNLSGFSFARVQMKPASAKVQAKNHPEQKQSMGYGFVGFSDVDSAKKATKSMQGFVLDGHKLLVSFAGRGADDEEKKDGAIPKSKTTKMIVKNVPFEATKQDLKGLFGYVHSLSFQIDDTIDIIIIAVYTEPSSPSVSQRRSTRGLAVLHSWSLCLATKRRMRLRRCGIRICWGVIWCWIGRRKVNRILRC